MPRAEDIEVRAFAESDQASVEALYRAAFAGYQQHVPEIAACTGWFVDDKLRDGGDMSDIQKHYMDLSNQNKCFWVAVDKSEDKIVGCVGALPSTEFDPKDYFELVRMAVDDSYRGCGIAGQLLDALETFARDRGFKAVNLTTLDGMSHAMRFYPRYGFQQQRQEPLDVEELFKRKFESGNKVHVVHFVKAL